MSVLPNVILTGEFVILFSYDGKEGIIYRDSEVYDFYSRLYEEMLKECKCVSTNCCTIEEYLNTMMDNDWLYFVNQNPCFGMGFTREFLDKVILPEVPGREILIERSLADIERRTAECEKCRAFFSKKGVLQFLRTGRDNEFPPEFYRPLTEEEGKELIRGICNTEHPPYVSNRLIDDSKFHYESDTIIHIMAGRAMIERPDGQTNRKFVILEENSISEMLIDFFENLEEMQYVKSEEKTQEYLRGLL